MSYYYIEKDGRVFLLKKDGIWRFPTSKKDIPFRFLIKRKMPLIDVYFCEPIIDEFPSNWRLKDDIIIRNDVEKIVKIAINKSYLRHSAQAIIPNDREVLMVKGRRGLTKGFWNLPGGFITYGETPEQSIVREVKEEIGINVKIKTISGIYTNIFRTSGYYMIAFTYICDVIGGNINLNEEIEDVKYMDIKEAIKNTKNIFCKWALKDFIKLKGKIHIHSSQV